MVFGAGFREDAHTAVATPDVDLGSDGCLDRGLIDGLEMEPPAECIELIPPPADEEPGHVVAELDGPIDDGAYVLAVRARAKRGVRRRAGGCYQVDGVDYHDFVVVGLEPPAPATYREHCRQCCAGGVPAVDADAASASGSSSSSEP